MKYMLDTNICIYVINEGDESVRERFEEHAPEICISSITYAELCYGVVNSTHIERNTRELDVFRLDLEILPFGEDAGMHYAEIRRALRRRGTPIGANDLLLAAHARSLGAMLVTNNRSEFDRVPELRVENWV